MSIRSQRPRRLRKSESIRRLVKETMLSPDDFIVPLFAVPGKGIRSEIKSMPGVFHLSIDELVKEARGLKKLGINAVLLFGVQKNKDAEASAAYDENGLIPNAVSELKGKVDGLAVATDVCLCGYTDHGHCGVVKKNGNAYEIDNDRSVDLIARTALAHALAGADIIAPSDMMDGRIGAIRRAFETNSLPDTIIMSYAAKYASAFYGPFRSAADSPPKFGDRSTYQMDPANSDEAMREVSLDIAEGADIVMVKPALSYLDVICRVKSEFRVPVAAYAVSGEYSMIKAAARAGFLDETAAFIESHTSIKRAGADIIISYAAPEIVKKLK